MMEVPPTHPGVYQFTMVAKCCDETLRFFLIAGKMRSLRSLVQLYAMEPTLLTIGRRGIPSLWNFGKP